MSKRPIEILLVEDSPTDRLIAEEALGKSRLKNHVHSVPDGVEALKYIEQKHPYDSLPRPDLILLDLNLPRMNGHELLETIKTDPSYRSIPVIVLSSSEDQEDVAQSYDRHANCYITKPVDFRNYLKAVRTIEQFWFKTATLTPKSLAES